MKSRIFIGSSKEGLGIAKKMKGKLSANFEVNIWTDDLFGANESTLSSILKFVHAFDFGIFVATPDDKVENMERENSTFLSMRDNVLFEFGIFLGALGKGSSFLFAEKEVKLPSDMSGITSFAYDKDASNGTYNNLDEMISKLNRALFRHDKQTYYSLLPSTSIAISYFDNFLNKFANQIGYSECVVLDDKSYTPASLKVVVPDNLRGGIHEQVTALYRDMNLKEGTMIPDGSGRSLNVSFKEKSNNSVVIYDMPTSLSGIDDVIKSVVHDGTATVSEHQKLIEQKELRNFTKVLKAKISDSSFGESHIEIITESELRKNEMF